MEALPQPRWEEPLRAALASQAAAAQPAAQQQVPLGQAGSAQPEASLAAQQQPAGAAAGPGSPLAGSTERFEDLKGRQRDLQEAAAAAQGGPGGAGAGPVAAPTPPHRPEVTVGSFATAGRRGEDRMEDRHAIKAQFGGHPDAHLLAVFDGHRGGLLLSLTSDQGYVAQCLKSRGIDMAALVPAAFLAFGLGQLISALLLLCW